MEYIMEINQKAYPVEVSLTSQRIEVPTDIYNDGDKAFADITNRSNQWVFIVAGDENESTLTAVFPTVAAPQNGVPIGPNGRATFSLEKVYKYFACVALTAASSSLVDIRIGRGM